MMQVPNFVIFRKRTVKGTRSRFCACVCFSVVMANSEVVRCLQMSSLFITKGCNTVMTRLQSVTQCDPPSVDFLLNWHVLQGPLRPPEPWLASSWRRFMFSVLFATVVATAITRLPHHVLLLYVCTLAGGTTCSLEIGLASMSSWIYSFQLLATARHCTR